MGEGPAPRPQDPAQDCLVVRGEPGQAAFHQSAWQLPDFHVTSSCSPNSFPNYLRASGRPLRLDCYQKQVILLSETQIVLQIILIVVLKPLTVTWANGS